jgi:hypothetical protein
MISTSTAPFGLPPGASTISSLSLAKRTTVPWRDPK